MFSYKIKARCFVLGVLELGEFSAWNTRVRFHIRLLFQQNAAKLRQKLRENCTPQQQIAETYENLWQFAGHGQNCELAAKRENRGIIAARIRSQFSARTTAIVSLRSQSKKIVNTNEVVLPRKIANDSEEDLVLIVLFNYLAQRRCVWVHDIIRRRREPGEYHCLLQKLRLDSSRFRAHSRTLPSTFKELLNSVGLEITVYIYTMRYDTVD